MVWAGRYLPAFTIYCMASSGFSHKPFKSIVIGKEQTTAFGSLQVAQLTPSAQCDFVFGLNDRIVESIEYAGGYVSASNGYAIANSSTSASGSGAVQLRRGLKYAAGQGSLFRGTAVFDEPVAGNIQLIGAGNGECGYFFAYAGTTFGIYHQDTSAREIRRLDITTPADTETVTVTLDGQTAVIPVTGGLSNVQTAYQLFLGDYRQTGNGWIVDVVSGSVFFLSARAGPYSGSYSASGSISGPLGTFTRVAEGIAPASTFYPQSSWNIDKMDGTGQTRMVLDHQKGNVYEIGFQYLGQGNAFFGIEDSETGIIAPVHVIKNTNNRTTPVLRNPKVSGLVGSTNFGNTTNIVTKCASLGTFTEGIFKKLDPKFAHVRSFDSDASGVFRGLVALKVNRVFRGQACFGEMDLLRIGATNAAGGASGKPFQIGIFSDSQIDGPVNFQYENSLNSTVAYANLGTSSTGSTITNNLEPIFTFGVNSGNSVSIDLSELDYIFGPGRVIIIAFRSAAATSGHTLSINWFEQQ